MPGSATPNSPGISATNPANRNNNIAPDATNNPQPGPSSNSNHPSHVGTRTAAGGGGGGGDSDDDGDDNNNHHNNNNNNNRSGAGRPNRNNNRRGSDRYWRDSRYRGMLRSEAALFYDPATFLNVTDIGDMNRVCQHCNALTFPNERKGLCCNNGKVSMPPLPSAPDALLQLYSGSHSLSQHFLKNIQQFNGLFKFTSFGANIQLMSDNNGNRAWTPNFKVLGQIYHRLTQIFIDETNDFTISTH